MTMTNKFKKKAALILAIAMSIGTVQFPVSAAGLNEDSSSPVNYGTVDTMDEVRSSASSTPKLNKTSLTLTVGGAKTLKVTGARNVSWSSSDTSVCTVNKDGRVTAKHAGTAKIYAKAGGKTLCCKVKVVKKSSNNKNSTPKATNNTPSTTAADSGSTNGTSKGLAIKVVDDGYGNQKILLIEYDIDEVNPGSSADYAEEMLELINKERAKNGAEAIVLDDELCKAAQVRAKELAEKFSHTRPDGRDCFTVLKQYNIHCVYSGENIAYGTSTCEGAMDLWMNSSGHRANILRKGWKKVGVGYDSESNSWVQIFTD